MLERLAEDGFFLFDGLGSLSAELVGAFVEIEETEDPDGLDWMACFLTVSNKKSYCDSFSTNERRCLFSIFFSKDLSRMEHVESRMDCKNNSRAFEMRIGVSNETLPTSSSNCIIFFMRATGNFVEYLFRRGVIEGV